MVPEPLFGMLVEAGVPKAIGDNVQSAAGMAERRERPPSIRERLQAPKKRWIAKKGNQLLSRYWRTRFDVLRCQVVDRKGHSKGALNELEKLTGNVGDDAVKIQTDTLLPDILHGCSVSASPHLAFANVAKPVITAGVKAKRGH
jgi:hypothetical protein